MAYGTGFTVVRNATGDFTITFTTAFATRPTVMFAPYGTGVGYHESIVGTPTTTSVRVTWVNAGGSAYADPIFDFLAVG